MGPTDNRRSERVIVDVPIAIRGESSDHRPFQEETFTVTVSAHGALVMLGTKVAVGQKVTLLNPANWDEREAKVAYMGREHAGLAQVAIEFTKAAPEFWPISSPPQSWNAPKTFGNR
jgi:PilZ domain-containing protein